MNRPRLVTCKACGTAFTSRKRVADFCSRSCFAEFRRGVVKTPPHICAECKTPFRSAHGLAKFCSRRCSQVSRGLAVANAAEFWVHVAIAEYESCRPWQRGLDHHGYGQLRFNGKMAKAHRLAYEFTHGVTLTSEEHVLHKCDNPPCCNPQHLFLGDPQINMADCIAKGRMRHPPALRGSACVHAKLNEQDVAEIRQAIARHEYHRVIAARYGVSKSTIHAISRGQAWKQS